MVFSTGARVSNVVSCPNCEKKLAVKDEFKGRALICPQCKGRFTVPADDLPVAGAAASDAGMSFLDNLGPGSAGPTQGAGGATAPAFSTARATVGKTARAAGRSKKRAQRKNLVYIGGGIGAAVLVAIVAVAALNGNGSGSEQQKEPEDIRFGLAEKTRIELFQKLVSAVDQDGITKACKEDWYRLADEYKLDRSHIKDLLDEGFSFKNKKWVLPEATATAKNRALRMDWIRQRSSGPDPVLAL
jgi:hypothetical protein